MNEDSVKKKPQRNKGYINETGPGDYDIPNITGFTTIISDKKNGPCFSFGGKSQNS